GSGDRECQEGGRDPHGRIEYVSRMRLAAMVVFLSACGAGGTAAVKPSDPRRLLDERPHLTVPPSAGTAAALGRLGAAAASGDAAAGWARLHELIDLYD